MVNGEMVSRMEKQEMIDILRGKTQYTGTRWQQAKDVQKDFDEIADYLQNAAPVRHGHWELDDKYYVWKCSKCGKNPSTTKDLNGTGYIPTRRELWDYCPHCGAKMDGKDGEQDAAD